MAWLETDFRPGDPLHRIKARWLSEVANALNSLDVELHDDIAIPYVERPAYPGKWIIHLPAPGNGGGGAATPFNHRWRVTVASEGTAHTLRIEPGSLWRNDGAGVVDLGVAPDGETVTVADDGAWTAQTSGSGSLYVADASPAPLLVWGDPTSETRAILLRVADIVVASSGTTLVQRAVGDQLYSVGGGGSEPLRFLQVALRDMPEEFPSDPKRWCVYLGRSIPFTWLTPKGAEDGAPWDYDHKQGVVQAYPMFGGWYPFASQNELNDSSSRFLSLEVRLFAPSAPNEPSMDVVGGEYSNLLLPTWFTGTYAVSLPFAEIVGTEGNRQLRNFRIGDVSIDLVAANACNLLLKRNGTWAEVDRKADVEEDDEFAIAQWYALKVHCHNQDHDEQTFEVSLRESMLAYAGTPCISHASDHLGGIV